MNLSACSLSAIVGMELRKSLGSYLDIANGDTWHIGGCVGVLEVEVVVSKSSSCAIEI